MYEWDDNKNSLNIAKHGLDFVDAKEIWQADVLERASPQAHHGEKRIVALGMIRGRCIAVVYTWRGNVKRLISARKARKNEQEDYEDACG